MSLSIVSRRLFLKTAGVSLALPFLESTSPLAGATGESAASPRRLIVICADLGFIPDNFFPAAGDVGRGYQLTPYLELLKDFRESFTVFSGICHPELAVGFSMGHPASQCFLTAAPNPLSASFRNSISLDQYAVERLKPDTRFPSLTLSTGTLGLSYSATGVKIPPEKSPAALYARMFLEGSAKEQERERQRLEDGHSILDKGLDQLKRLQGRVTSADRERLDQYFTAVREAEQNLVKAKQWAMRPKPTVPTPCPQDNPNDGDYANIRLKLLLDQAYLAFQTDSTRFITLMHDYYTSWHLLSHHGKDPIMLTKLKEREAAQIEVVREFLTKLRQTKEAGSTMLDRTMVLFGSQMGDANRHSADNVPIILVGGGFQHGQHIGFDREKSKNMALCRLFVSMLQRLGIETDRFATGKGRIEGLELA
jgi:Protein of unknown function (DUF1552)